MMRLPTVVFLAVTAFAADTVLRVEGTAGNDGAAQPALQLSLADLQGMPRISVQVKNHDGEDHKFEGVAVSEVPRRAGLPQGEVVRGPMLSRYLLASAHDGYRAMFSLPELDPGFIVNRALLADRMDGGPLSSRDGPLRLVLPAEKQEARWIRMVERIGLMPAPAPVR